MISKITGKLLAIDEDQATLGVDHFEYQVSIPDCVRRQLQSRLNTSISLHTLYYLDGTPVGGRLIPRLVGFLNETEREFFELFCSVDGVGAKKALRAMVRAVPEIAVMIEEQDTKGLSTLPGVGAATAERIIAKLRRKMSKFALLVVTDAPREAEVRRDIVEETFTVLVSLGHTDSDARQLLDKTLATKEKFTDVQTLLNAVYKLSHAK